MMNNRNKVKENQNLKISKKNNDRWQLHDLYSEAISSNRVVTRSQIAFALIRNTESDTELFADISKHHPPSMTHLMNTLKGEYGAVPRTKINRKLAANIEISEDLCKAIDKYKTARIPNKKDDAEKEESDKAITSKSSDEKRRDSKENTAYEFSDENQGESNENALDKFSEEEQGEEN